MIEVNKNLDELTVNDPSDNDDNRTATEELFPQHIRR